jgi:hypothetical protein
MPAYFTSPLTSPSNALFTDLFVHIEGERERSYGTLLNELLDPIRRDVHLDAVLLGGGDHLALVERADLHIRLKHEQATPIGFGVGF